MSVFLWSVAVLGYVVQTKCISHMVFTSQQNVSPFYLTFVHLSSWLLVLPLTQLFFRVKYGLVHGRSMWSIPQLSSEETEFDTEAQEEQQPEKRFSIWVHAIKIAGLAILLSLGYYTYFTSIKLSPALDIAIIHNISKFEICSLLLGVCGISSRRHLFKNYVLLVTILVGVLIVSYTKATCDFLAGKLSVNAETGELTDPFLFDRLKGALICGLGALVNGPATVLWNKWIVSSFFSDKRQKSRLYHSFMLNYQVSLVGVACLVLLGPILIIYCRDESLLGGFAQNSGLLLASIFLGNIPMILAFVHLSEKSCPEFATTCYMGSIIATAISDWLAESGGSIITRWEVIGYFLISIGGVILGFNYRSQKNC
ncbi:LAMI_0B06062g1_1 [Lachancea mirantina]|uniref:LAMI_0B06062g1_1 n=1 Tax=Lachancea mirantina TaxID=1230905 RepID=A0A1G4IWT1_9SACH|nr:LAMI_0B06062g1_1 [Lachancea mirantina]